MRKSLMLAIVIIFGKQGEGPGEFRDIGFGVKLGASHFNH